VVCEAKLRALREKWLRNKKNNRNSDVLMTIFQSLSIFRASSRENLFILFDYLNLKWCFLLTHIYHLFTHPNLNKLLRMIRKNYVIYKNKIIIEEKKCAWMCSSLILKFVSTF
jgi:hypothetical protein